MAQVSICLPLILFLIFQSDLLQCYDIGLSKPNISPECELEGICDNVKNYPMKLVKGLIDKLESQNTIFNYDEAPLPNFNMRFNVEEPLSLCETKSRFLPPQAAKDMNGDWQFIINDSKKPVQVFRIEICRKSMGRCSENITFIQGYDGACIQKMLRSQNTIFNYEEAPAYITTYRTDEDDYSTWIRNSHQPLGIHIDKINDPGKKSFWLKKINKKPLSLCETKTQFVPPKSAQDMNGNWKFIINDSEDPVQVFRIETCRTPMSRCSENIVFIPGYDGVCLQNKVLREMYYVNETNEIAKTYFEVPTCCSCSLLRKDNDK